MADLSAIFIGSVEEWINALPSYQAQLINSLLESSDLSESAAIWLDASIAENTAPLGAIRVGMDAFYDRLLEELHKLFCTKTGYTQERANLLKDARAGRQAIIVAVATAISPEIHVSAIILAPAIAVTMAILSAAGTASVCASLDELIQNRKDAATSADST